MIGKPKQRPALFWPLIVLALIVLSASNVGADWLVTQEGARVETKGPWKVKGSLVVFTMPNGTLSSLRLSEVDLDRSAEATYEAENPPAEADDQAENKKPKTVLTLTDADIKRATPANGSADDDPPAGAAPTGRTGDTIAGVTINEPFGLLNWHVDPAGGGIEVQGALLYKGGEGATEIVEGLNMILRLVSSDGATFAETSASLTTPTLQAGSATTFRAVFSTVETEQEYSFVVEVESR